MSRSVVKDGFPAYVSAWEDRIGAFLEIREPEHWPGTRLSGEANTLPRDASTPFAEGVHGASSSSASVAGLPFAVKDNIAVEGFGLTCASKLLEHFRATYTATAVQRLQSEGAVVIGKTNMDEFGMGSSTDNSALKQTNNPWDERRVAGGSSGGSAAAVAAGLVPFALGSDTGGSVRQPAAFCGVVGLKPTYGAVSRYGLVAYASSLETIGVLADSVGRARDVFRIIQGPDPMDQTTAAARLVHGENRPLPGNKKVLAVLNPASLVQAVRDAVRGAAAVSAATAQVGVSVSTAGFSAAAAQEAAGGGVGEDAHLINLLEEEVLAGFSKAVEAYRALGYEIREVTIPSLAYSVPVYYTIATAEASANLARFDGIRYGKRPEWAENPEDLIDKTRAMGFGSEVKLRILLGTFVLRSGFQDRYYLRAQQLRKQITREFVSLFSGKDGPQGLLMPVFPTRAFGRASGKAVSTGAGKNSGTGDKGGVGDTGGAGGPALSSFAQKAADLFTCPANLAGLPALAFPASVEGGLPVGVQLLGAPFSEELLCSIAAEYEADHPIPHPEGFQSYWR